MNGRDESYIILGNGMAGISAAKAIRACDKDCRIVMISEEDVPTYSRPMLTKTSLRSYDLKRTFLYPADWYAENGIELVLATKVEKLDAVNRKVMTTRGAYDYDKCIYALGASNFIPPIPGADLPPVANVRTYKDIGKIKQLSLGATSAAVIGGGVIGLEVALELVRLGIRVTVIEALPYLMPRLIDEETAMYLEKLLSPIRIITGASVSGIAAGEKAADVSLADGTVIPADLVVISAGVRANMAIAKEAGIGCERAVVVNEYMETSMPGVYAGGDCAQYKGMNYALWSQARVQGEVAGANACGKKRRCGMIDSSLILNSPEFALFAAGDPGKNPALHYTVEVEEKSGDGTFAVNPGFVKGIEKRWYSDGKLTGAVRIGSLAGIDALRRQIFPEKEVYDEA